MGWAYIMYGGGEEVRKGFLWGNLRKRDVGIDWRKILKSILKKGMVGGGGRGWTGLVWHRIGTSGGIT
jgi:hypothetical protein